MDKLRYWVDLAYELFKTYDRVTITYNKDSVRTAVPRVRSFDSGSTRGKTQDAVRNVDSGSSAGL
jgi:hypothetical protein